MKYTKQQQLQSKRRKPKQKERTRIKAKEYEKAIEYWGNTCFCQNPSIEMHHVKFRSAGGKGNWRNLHPLCKHHHQLAHADNEYRRHLEVIHQRTFGKWYWMDKYDLYHSGLIAEPTEELLEGYFEKIAREKRE